ncbi:HU family DNA-binding protein [Barnesiella intestinihominis]|jgi:nucleoid DNA-binding protein/nucleoid-associated protein YgaU|uniref:HU family DNA-binding protein n=1 Tax=Barnesiella intestinihominis TaxID=487174 RepID=UPI003AF1756E
MNEKISFPDLVGLLSSKMNITKKEAETFLKEFFTVSTEVITSGEELRINGLGLFKPIWVEARGSINIQTGEPVEIPGHYKLSFIPDKVLREAVNAPFSSFSVEVLNDHVPIEDMTAVPSQDIDENNDICNTENVELQDSKEIREKEEEDEPIEPAHEYIQEDKSADEESSESTVSSQEIEKFQEEIIQPESETKVEEKEEDCYEDYLRKSASRKSFWWGVLSAFGIIICLAGGIFFMGNDSPYVVKIGEYTLSLGKQSIDSRPMNNNPESVVLPENKDTLSEMEKDSVLKDSVISVSPLAAPEVKPVIETIRSGIFLTTLARKYFGHKAFWVYIYEENKDVIKNPNQVPIGTRLTIPSASKYDIDANNRTSVENAKALAAKIQSRYE